MCKMTHSNLCLSVQHRSDSLPCCFVLWCRSATRGHCKGSKSAALAPTVQKRQPLYKEQPVPPSSTQWLWALLNCPLPTWYSSFAKEGQSKPLNWAHQRHSKLNSTPSRNDVGTLPKSTSSSDFLHNVHIVNWKIIKYWKISRERNWQFSNPHNYLHFVCFFATHSHVYNGVLQAYSHRFSDLWYCGKFPSSFLQAFQITLVKQK